MKKFAKMSLVAAVAVASMTTANAKDLTEAIKDVDVSGTILYRYNDYNAEDTGAINNNQNYYKAVLNLKSKVNEDVSANVSVAANNNFSAMDTRTTGDGNVDIQLTKVNFAYTGIKNTTVIAGKQGIPTPWTVASDADADEQTGTGILALSTWGPVTVAGAYFNQNNFHDTGVSKGVGYTYKAGTPTDTSDDEFTKAFDGSEDIATIGLIANIGPVALDAWYLSLMDSEGSILTDANIAAVQAGTAGTITAGTNIADVSFDSYTVGASYSMDVSSIKLGLKARYTNLEFDEKLTAQVLGNDSEDNSLWHATLSAKMGMFGAAIGYGATDKDGGLAAINNNAKSGFQGWNTNLNGVKDADLIKFNVNAQVMPSLNVALNWNELDSDADDSKDREEIFTQLSYNMSKNFGGYLRLGTLEQDDKDSTVGRLQVQYSF